MPSARNSIMTSALYLKKSNVAKPNFKLKGFAWFLPQLIQQACLTLHYNAEKPVRRNSDPPRIAPNVKSCNPV